MESSHKGEYRYQEHRAEILFDFSREASIDIPEFFHNFSLHFQKVISDDIRLVSFRIKGFSKREYPESIEDTKVRESFQEGHGLLDRILSLKIPVISFINGHVAGPLLEPILFTDFLFAAPKTRISSLFIEKGYYPRMGMLSKLLEILGRRNLIEFLLNGLELSLEAKESFPLLYQMTEGGEEKLDHFSKELLEKGDYPVRLIKELSHYGKVLSPTSAYIMERYNFALCFSDLKFKEKIESFFKERS